MKRTIEMDGSKYCFLIGEKQEYRSDIDQIAANESMRDLEEKLENMGFECIQDRKIKWEPKQYLAVVSDLGRFVHIETYFDRKDEMKPDSHGVYYAATGLESDVRAFQDRLNDRPVKYTCFTCR